MSDNSQAMLPFPSQADNDLLYLSTLAIEGADASAFLQGQLTQDVTLCAQGAQMVAALNPKGRAYATGWLIAIPTGFLWVLPQSILQTTLQTLKRYILRSKVTLTDTSPDWSISLSPIASATKGTPCLPQSLQAATGWFGYIHSTADIGATNWFAWHECCLEAGYATLTPATQEKYTVHELDFIRWQGVSFTKGCYTGQEIVARMHYRATPKTALNRIQLDGFHPQDIAYGDTLTVPQSHQSIDLVDGQWQTKTQLRALAVVPHALPSTAALSSHHGSHGTLQRRVSTDAL